VFFKNQRGFNIHYRLLHQHWNICHCFCRTFFFDTIAFETNRYANQKIAITPDPKWRPTDSFEIRAFFAINILMGIKSLPRLWMVN
jgi:hypothetical protein